MVAGKQRHIFNTVIQDLETRIKHTYTNTGDDYCSEKSKEGMSVVSEDRVSNEIIQE